jgi:hypothetical protein
MRFVVILVLAVVLPLSSAAQRGGSGFHGGAFHGNSSAGLPSSHRYSGGESFALGRRAYASKFSRYSPYDSLLLPYFGDAFSLDDLYASGYPVASQPPMIPLQAALALAESRRGVMGDALDHAPALAEPLMIELKNGQYVRVSGAAAEGQLLTLPADVQSGRLVSNNSPESSASARSLPSTVLVFRDGHTEEVRDYTIADGILYAHGDFYTDGYWSKKITLASLDLPQSVQANNSRNVKFDLPASPNEVIARF